MQLIVGEYFQFALYSAYVEQFSDCHTDLS